MTSSGRWQTFPMWAHGFCLHLMFFFIYLFIFIYLPVYFLSATFKNCFSEVDLCIVNGTWVWILLLWMCEMKWQTAKWDSKKFFWGGEGLFECGVTVADSWSHTGLNSFTTSSWETLHLNKVVSVRRMTCKCKLMFFFVFFDSLRVKAPQVNLASLDASFSKTVSGGKNLVTAVLTKSSDKKSQYRIFSYRTQNL